MQVWTQTYQPRLILYLIVREDHIVYLDTFDRQSSKNDFPYNTVPTVVYETIFDTNLESRY